MNNYPLVIIAGPTAIGKSNIAVKLAKIINGEIISADSMQVYRGMDIGTAKISDIEMDGIKHYLIDVLDPSEDFGVAYFKNEANRLIKDINMRGKIPIIVGGTGFYIQSVLYDIDFNDEAGSNEEIRSKFTKIAEVKGPKVLHDMLRQVDEDAANEIHMNNVKRVVRALEFYEMTGKKISEHNKEQKAKESPYNFCYFVLTDDRQDIYSRIDARVDEMIKDGLVEEVKRLVDIGLNPNNNISMLGLSYKEIYDYLMGDTSLEEAIRLIKRDTRHFAKKQITWFKGQSEVIPIIRRESNLMLEEMLSNLRNNNII